MKFEEIIKEFDKEDQIFKEDQVLYIKEHKEDFIDDLLKLIKDYTDNMDENIYPISVLYSLFLLSEFKEKRLYPYLIKMLEFQYPNNMSFFEYFGDGMFEMMSCFLVSTFNNDFDSLNRIIENDKYDEDSRHIAVSTYSYLCRNNFISKEELIIFLNKIIDNILKKSDDPNYGCYMFVNGILDVIIECNLRELLDKVKLLYENDFVDPLMFGDYNKYLSYVGDTSLSYHTHQIEDTISEFSQWAMFCNESKVYKKNHSNNKPSKKKKKKQPKTNYKNKKKKKKK